jgi:hypothetical protein
LQSGVPAGCKAVLELEPAQGERDDTYGEPAQQLEHVGPGSLPAKQTMLRKASDADAPI